MLSAGDRALIDSIEAQEFPTEFGYFTPMKFLKASHRLAGGS